VKEGVAGGQAVEPERGEPTTTVERVERPVEAPPRRARDAAVPAQATPAPPEPLPAPIMPAEAPRVRPEPAVAEAPATTPAKDIFDVVVERPPQATSVPAKAEVLPAVVEPTPRPTPAPVGVPEKSVAKP